MLSVVRAHKPDVLIIDELSTKDEVKAAQAITGRGVAIVAGVRGRGFSSVADDPSLCELLGLNPADRTMVRSSSVLLVTRLDTQPTACA